jgi:hypothetical protein
MLEAEFLSNVAALICVGWIRTQEGKTWPTKIEKN